MKIAVLRIEQGEAGQLSYTFGEEPRTCCTAQGPFINDLNAFDAERRSIWSRYLSDGSDVVRRAAPLFVRAALPPSSGAVARALRAWGIAAASLRILCLHFDVQDETLLELLSFLPWELLPHGLGLPDLLVVRRPPGAVSREVPGDAAPILRLVAARTYRGAPTATAVEVEALSRRFALPLGATELSAATPERLLAELAEGTGNLLHVATPAVRHAAHDAELLLDEAQVPQPSRQWLSVRSLGALLGLETPLLLAVLNGPQTGPIAARMLTLSTGAVSVGWLGAIDAEEAGRFAVFFYDHLLGRGTIAESILAFLKSVPPQRAGSLPVVWVSSPEAVCRPLPRPPCDRISHGNESFHGPRPYPVEIKLPSLLSPSLVRGAATVVAGLFVDRGVLPALRDARSLRVQVECDTGMGKSTYAQMIEVGAGAHLSNAAAFRFPVLHELVRQRVDRRDVTFTTRLLADDQVIFEESRCSVWLGYNEWIDHEAGWPYLPAYVQPQSNAVRDIIDHAERVLSDAGSPGTFVGYGAGARDHVTAQVRAFFQALQRAPFALRAIGPGSLFAALDGDTPVGGQVVRLADEVVAHGRGTCHDLSLLLAACAEHVRIWPLLFLQEGHTLVGFWRDPEEQQRFWRSRPAPEAFGEEWLVREAGAIREMIGTGDIAVVEATDITRPTVSFEDACRHAESLVGRGGFRVAVDVVLARLGVHPL